MTRKTPRKIQKYDEFYVDETRAYLLKKNGNLQYCKISSNGKDIKQVYLRLKKYRASFRHYERTGFICEVKDD